MGDFYPVNSNEVNEFLSNLHVNNVATITTVNATNITSTNPPSFPTVITDATDMTLSSGFLMVGNSGLDIKQSLIDATSNNLVFPTNKYVQVDEIKSLVGDSVTISADTNLNLNGAQILTNCDLKIETTKKLYVDKILDQNNAGSVDFEANINAITHDITSDNLISNSLTSNAGSDLTINSVANKDILIDALGTGKIKVNTVQNSGVIITTSEQYPVYISKDTTLYNSLILATYSNSPFYPFLGCTLEGVGTRPLRLSFNNTSVVIGDISSADNTFVHALDVNGSINIRNNGSFYINDAITPVIDNSKNIICNNIICNNLTINGTYRKEGSSYLNQSVAHPSTLSGIYLCLPTGITTLRQFDILVSLAGADGTANISVYDSAGLLLFTLSTNINGVGQRLSQSGNYAVPAGFIELRTSWTGGTVGTFTLASYCASFL